MRRAARVDANQPAIVAALESVGCTVRSLAALGKDCEDLLVGFRGANYLMEIKNPESSGKHRGASKISEGQRKQQVEWQGQTAIVWTVDEALGVVGAYVDGNGRLDRPEEIRFLACFKQSPEDSIQHSSMAYEFGLQFVNNFAMLLAKSMWAEGHCELAPHGVIIGPE